jgi:hypothetical protein
VTPTMDAQPKHSPKSVEFLIITGESRQACGTRFQFPLRLNPNASVRALPPVIGDSIQLPQSTSMIRCCTTAETRTFGGVWKIRILADRCLAFERLSVTPMMRSNAQRREELGKVEAGLIVRPFLIRPTK